MTGFLSPTHILLLLLVALLLFGAKRLPEVGRSLGSGLREFKHSIDTEPAERPTLAAAAAPHPSGQAGNVSDLKAAAQPTPIDGGPSSPAA